MQINFNNKIVIVTGAMRGIGKQIAQDLYRAGATLLVTGTDEKQIIAKNRMLKREKRIKYYYLDLLKEDSINEFISEIKKRKKIDVCINNAGINRINYIYNTSLQDWDDILKVNLRGPFIFAKEIGDIMRKNGYGRIVNIASILGVITREKRSAYTASKAGLIGLTKTTAIDLAPHNILVNAVSPGFILTDLTKRMLKKEEIRNLKSLIPVGRIGKPKDISTIVLFLASDLNTYITGQNIIADGGYVDI